MFEMILAFMFPFAYLFYLLVKKPKQDYEKTHHAHKMGDMTDGYWDMDYEVFNFRNNHKDGYGFNCFCLNNDKIINPIYQVYPLDKREFLQTNEEAAKMYRNCMAKHIAWSRGMVPYDLRKTYRTIDPYKEYYDKFGGEERLFYRDNETIYEKNCIRSPEDRENEFCKRCAFAQNKIARSYFAQRLVDYNQNPDNLTSFGERAYSQYIVKRDETPGARIFNCSDEGLNVRKWNLAQSSKSALTLKRYQNYNELETLEVLGRVEVYCKQWGDVDSSHYCDFNWCRNCKEVEQCMKLKKNKDFQF